MPPKKSVEARKEGKDTKEGADVKDQGKGSSLPRSGGSLKGKSDLPLYHWSRVIEARVPIGFVMHMTANYLLEYHAWTLQIPLIFLVWWELAKEFPNGGFYLQIIMTVISLGEMYILESHPEVFEEYSLLQIAIVQFLVIFAICALLRVKLIDNIILNYLFFGVTLVNIIIHSFVPEVMLSISMAIAGSDCLQYFVGKRIGKTKIVPAISPNKSLEGYIGAVVICNILQVLLFEHKLFNIIYLNGLLLAGIFGDLFISWWKRNHHIKDTSHIFTGHGGVLDRLDSHIAAWIWSYLFAYATGFIPSPAHTNDPAYNFTQMDYDIIEYLIFAAWAAVWLRFFYCLFFKGEWI